MPSSASFGHRRHGIRLVRDGKVIEDAFLFLVHAPDAVAHDHGDLVCEGGIEGPKIRQGISQKMAVAVLMLKPLTGERRAPGRAANQKAACTSVARRPDQVANPLEAEHGVKDKKWNHGDAMSGIGGPGGDEGRHGAGLGNAFFEDLSVCRFLVVKQCFAVDRVVS